MSDAEWKAKARGIIEAQTAAANAQVAEAQATIASPYCGIVAVSSATLRRGLAEGIENENEPDGVSSDTCAVCDETFARYTDANSRECCALCRNRRRHPGEWLMEKVTTWSGPDYIQHFKEGWSCCGQGTEEQWSGCTFASPHVLHAERFYAPIQFVDTNSWKPDLQAAGARLEAQYDTVTDVGGLSAEAAACAQSLPDPSPAATDAVRAAAREKLARFVASGGKQL